MINIDNMFIIACKFNAEQGIQKVDIKFKMFLINLEFLNQVQDNIHSQQGKGPCCVSGSIISLKIHDLFVIRKLSYNPETIVS